MANGENSIVMGYVYNSEGKPEAVGAMMPPQLPGKVSALEGRVDALETSGGTGSGPALSDAVDSTSSTTAASSMAVKTAYDKALEAQDSAEAADGKAGTAQTAAEAAATVAQSAKTSAETAQAAADAAMQQAILGGSGGGAAVITLTEDKVLAATDPRNLLVSADMPGRSITLPAASTIEADGIAFRIAVDGDYDVTVKDAQGRPVGGNSGKIAVGGTRLFLLMDKESSLWRWADWKGGESGGSGSGTTVVPGVGYVFNSGAVRRNCIASLSDTKAIIAFQDTSNSSYGTACVLDISGSNIAVGEKAVFQSASTDFIFIVPISSSKAIVLFRTSESPYYVAGCILTESDGIITVGTQKTFSSLDTLSIYVALLTETKAIAVFNDESNSSYGTACVFNISGDEIVIGEKSVFNNGSAPAFSIARLNDTKAIVAFKDQSNDRYGKACVLSVSDSSVTAGEKVIFNPRYTSEVAVAAFSETKAIVAFKDDTNDSSGTARILNISGNSVSVESSSVDFITQQMGSFYLASLSETQVIVAYQDTNNSCGKVRALNVFGNEISVSEEATFSRSALDYVSIGALASNKAVVAWRDDGNSSYGTACVLNIV